MVVRKRLDIKGPALVFVTTTVNNWIPVFSDEHAADIIVRQLKDSLDYFQTSLIGYVIMPTHLHALLGFSQIERLSKFMQSFKILTSKAVKEVVSDACSQSFVINGHFKLWKSRFDDLIINSEQQFRVKLEYIHNNPVKAGLIDNACDWKYSSASDWLENRCGLLSVNKDFGWTN